MIKTVSVYNFKAIEALENASFDRITLVGGKNNSGKTTLLEALFLSMDYKSPDVLNRLTSWREMTGKFLPKDIWRLFFYKQDMSRNIKRGFISKYGLKQIHQKFSTAGECAYRGGEAEFLLVLHRKKSCTRGSSLPGILLP